MYACRAAHGKRKPISTGRGARRAAGLRNTTGVLVERQYISQLLPNNAVQASAFAAQFLAARPH